MTPESVEIPGFEALQVLLYDLAAPPFEQATLKHQMAVHRFANVSDPVAFAELLGSEDRLSEAEVQTVSRIIALARDGDLETAGTATQDLVTQLSQASTPESD